MKITRMFVNYNNHKNRNDDGRPHRCGRTCLPSSDLQDMSDSDSPYFRHSLIDLATYVIHLMPDLWDLGESEEEAMIVVAAEMDSRATTAMVSASKTRIRSGSEELTYLQMAKLYFEEERRRYRKEEMNLRN